MRITWLLALNYYCLQWFFVRVARVIDDETGRQLGWTVIVRRPMSGWIWED